MPEERQTITPVTDQFYEIHHRFDAHCCHMGTVPL